MCAEEVGLHGQRSRLLDASDHAKHLQLILHCQSVAALDFDGSGTHGHDLTDSYHRLFVEVVFRGVVQQIGRVEDSAATCCDLLIAQSGNLVPELTVAATCIHDMCVAVTERRHHNSSLSVDVFSVIHNSTATLIAGGGGVLNTTATAIIRAELGNSSILNDQVSILNALHGVHLCTFQLSHISRQYTRQHTYIIYYSLHQSFVIKYG